MTARRARISQTTKYLVERLREAQTDEYWTYALARHPRDYRVGYCAGLRQAITTALIHETPWSLNQDQAWIDKQLAAAPHKTRDEETR